MSKIATALKSLFERNRIVFWYDTKKELRAEYEELSLEGITKVELKNNEFALKYRILREEPSEMFLLYKEGAQPKEEENWLLDVQLCHEVFQTGQLALWLSELELGQEFLPLLEEHSFFFGSGKRRETLKASLDRYDTKSDITLKMIAVCAGSELRAENVLEKLLEEFSKEKETKIKLLEKTNLLPVLWSELEKHYNYQNEEKSIEDFSIELFKSCYFMGLDEKTQLNDEAQIFLNRWKDSKSQEASFRLLSERCEEILGIEEDLEHRTLEQLIEVDCFELVERRIISALVQGLNDQSLSAASCTSFIRQRRQSHWYAGFEDLYKAIETAANFIYSFEDLILEIDSLQEGIDRYCSSWFKIDQLYRKYIYFLAESRQTTILTSLSEKVENLYSNEYLLKLGNRWQKQVDALETWKAPVTPLQKDFFEDEVKAKLKSTKVFVIISDALRYEVADELVSVIRQANKFNAELSPNLSMLPSYTQLGMAALLPNESLEIIADKTTTVLVDGQSSKGSDYRAKQLKKSVERSCVVKAKDVLKYNRDEIRSFSRENEVAYIYHNLIDHAGDKLESEETVFEAAQKTVEELSRIVRKIAGENIISNFIITADHGFLYQNQKLEDSDFLTDKFDEDEVLYYGRRFAYGQGLEERDAFKKLSSTELGLVGDLDVLIPKSINRLRLKGSGSRFVHGGASLQEVVIPVINVSKRRADDAIRQVDVEILQSGSSVITSGLLAVTLYQSEEVTDKVQKRELRAGIYNKAGELISDSHDLSFDLRYKNPRERELPLRLMLSSKADDSNGQEVTLRLEERQGTTSHYTKYKETRYILRRSFTSDFDF